ncbi:hypothetical protein WI75_26245 [Burkholderia ubonensis]|nr:hypothetical protein WI75_26245 [Burkholderia ubonensis]KVL63047.1 hypothetical protein WJ48_24030 [Burkholderia ubonensis]KVL76926.1 hypothetical protein WJ49_11280 [Burkholderia ubonensis]KVL91666.1 hypothetical protein WJ50_00465 [Burkholderia ubonensis]
MNLQRSLLAFTLVLLCSEWGFAAALTKAKILSPSVEAKWIANVKHHRTKDGRTVEDVLAYAEKMRPRKFKAGKFDVAYNGATGTADTVAIAYWIGLKRSPDDAFVDLGYHMSSSGQVMAVPPEEVFTTALENGRDTFLRAVDDAYRMDCMSDPDGSPTC